MTDTAPAPAAAPVKEAAAPVPAPAAPAADAHAHADDHKVFVGNLPFSTTNAELKEFFAGHPVSSATVIHRGPRSLGYGFVSFANEADAEAAVKALDKSELGGREINVEVAKAKPHDGAHPAPAPRTRGAPRPRGTGSAAPNPYSRPVNGTGEDTADPEAFHAAQAHGSGFRPRGGYRGGYRGRGRGRGAAAAAAAGGEHADAAAVVPVPAAAPAHAEGEHADHPRGRGRGRGRGGRGAARGASASAPTAGAAAGAGATHAGKPLGEVDGSAELSKTTLFVANVPFRYGDAELLAVFSGPGYAVKSAHVVKMRSGRSKGFGFVEAENEEAHAKILKECATITAEGRELVVRAALASQLHHPHEHDHEEAPAAAEVKAE